MPKPLHLLASSGSAAAAALVDYAVGWSASPNPLYLAPVALFAWQNDRRAGLWVATLASLAYAVVDLAGGHARLHGGLNLTAVTLQVAACIGIALMADGVHRLMITCRRGSAQVDPLEDRIAIARIQMRAINPDGSSRERDNVP